MSTTKQTRREFMASTVAAAAVASAVGGLPIPAPPGRAHLVGLGRAGGTFLDYVLPRLPPAFDRNVHRITTDHRAGLLARSFLGLDLAPFLPHDPVVIFVGLGGKTGSAGAPRLVKAMLEKAHPAVVLCSLPFAFEGRERRTRAETAARTMEEFGARLLVVDFQAALQEGHSSEAAFGRVERLALEVVLRVGVGVPPPSMAAWRSFTFSDRRDVPLARF